LKSDKLIKDSKLVERLDKLDPDNASGSKNDGINYGKGKKIVTLAEWKKKIGRNDKTFQKIIEDVKIKEALQYFPDDYDKSLFPLKVSQELLEAAKKWNNQYLELMYFRKNLKCSRLLCYNCLLCPDKEKSGNYVGISRFLARAIEANNDDEDSINNSNSNTPRTIPSPYPCSVLNIFKCPYDRDLNSKKPKHQQQKRKKEGAEKDSNSCDIDDLFLFSQYARRVESALIKARKENSIVTIKNVEDIYNALTDKETLDKVLLHGLDDKGLKYKEEIVEFFMSIKDNIRMEDLTFYKPIAP
jgi:hypothetical protein